MEEAATLTKLMTLSRSCFEKSKMVGPWLIIMTSSIA